jgi:hypothetical protein
LVPKGKEDGIAQAGFMKTVINEVFGYFSNMRFLIPYIINQTASLLNNFVVASNELQIAVPCVNCVTFISAFVTQRLLKGESLVDIRFYMGVTLILVGISICLQSPSHAISF